MLGFPILYMYAMDSGTFDQSTVSENHLALEGYSPNLQCIYQWNIAISVSVDLLFRDGADTEYLRGHFQ